MRLSPIVSLALIVAAPAPAQTAALPAAVVADPPRDADNPPAMAALVIPSGAAAMNAVLYVAAGQAPHPTLLLLHGFPGNEQNLDLAQAARRAGWNVLTLHYRGSWGSPGRFSFAHSAEDAAAAIAYLRRGDVAARHRIDPRRIAVAGHSMGGMMAARVVADDPALLGAFLIDPWDIARDAALVADPAALARFKRDELDGDMPPLATTEQAVIDEIAARDPRLDLASAMRGLATRPLALVYAERGNGPAEAKRIETAARVAGATRLDASTWPTDHGFQDMRIVLAGKLVDWLGALPPAR